MFRLVVSSGRRLSLAIIFVALFMSGCAEPEKPAAMVHGRPAGASFAGYGEVTFHPGQPCASQIMFDFHSAGSTSVSMAAPIRVSRILTEAVRDHKRVHVSGKWRRGKTADCRYVEATQAEVEKSFW